MNNNDNREKTIMQYHMEIIALSCTLQTFGWSCKKRKSLPFDDNPCKQIFVFDQ